MKQKQTPEDMFHLLENVDEEDIFHLSEHYLSADKSEMERIFAMSEKKYDEMTCQESARQPDENGQMQSRTAWQNILIAAAACLVITVGAISGISGMNRSPQEEILIENTDISETRTEIRVTETSVPETTTEPQKTESETTQTSTESTSSQIHTANTAVVQNLTETTQNSIAETTVQRQQTEEISTEAIQPETELSISAEETDIIETLEVVSETEASLPETEVIITTETSSETTTAITETTVTAETTAQTTAESEEAPLPGFIVQVREYEGISEKFDLITAVPDENAPETLKTHYQLAWLPEGYVLSDTAGTEYLFSQIYQNQENHRFLLHQYLQSEFVTEMNHDAKTEMRSAATVNENPGFCTRTVYHDILSCYVYWKQDGYVFFLETYEISPADAMKMAESIQPIQD